MALGRWPHLASVPPEAGNSPQDRRCCAVEWRAPSSRRLPDATSVQYQNAARGRRPPRLPRARAPSARGQPRTPGTSRLSRPRAAAARADGRAVLVGRLGAREGGGRRGYARARARAPPAEALRPSPAARGWQGTHACLAPRGAARWRRGRVRQGRRQRRRWVPTRGAPGLGAFAEAPGSTCTYFRVEALCFVW